jgi:hypothetical protein
MDARHNMPRLGRTLMAVGRDAADVAITTSFGNADLKKFVVNAYEIDTAGKPAPLPLPPMMMPGHLDVPMKTEPKAESPKRKPVKAASRAKRNGA